MELNLFLSERSLTPSDPARLVEFKSALRKCAARQIQIQTQTAANPIFGKPGIWLQENEAPRCVKRDPDDDLALTLDASHSNDRPALQNRIRSWRRREYEMRPRSADIQFGRKPVSDLHAVSRSVTARTGGGAIIASHPRLLRRPESVDRKRISRGGADRRGNGRKFSAAGRDAMSSVALDYLPILRR